MMLATVWIRSRRADGSLGWERHSDTTSVDYMRHVSETLRGRGHCIRTTFADTTERFMSKAEIMWRNERLAAERGCGYWSKPDLRCFCSLHRGRQKPLKEQR